MTPKTIHNFLCPRCRTRTTIEVTRQDTQHGEAYVATCKTCGASVCVPAHQLIDMGVETAEDGKALYDKVRGMFEIGKMMLKGKGNRK